MTDGPGRTYKYLKDPAANSLWPFAFGLSYTNFSLSKPTLTSAVLRADTETAAVLSVLSRHFTLLRISVIEMLSYSLSDLVQNAIRPVQMARRLLK